MSFTPLARFRNFTVDNLKALLEVYPDMHRMSWDEARDFAETKMRGYKRTAYQQACQLGLEDRSTDSFRIHNYLYTFDDENLENYLTFWFKIYFAPNPYVKSNDSPFLIYCRLCEVILKSANHSINFSDFMEENIGGESDDILLNAIKKYANPIQYKLNGDDTILYIVDDNVELVKKEIDFIKKSFPITDPKSKAEFFKRFDYLNFCKFYRKEINDTIEDSRVHETEEFVRMELPFNQSKDCARMLVDYIYNIDNFERLSNVLKSNDKTIKIDTDNLGGNYLRYMFVKSTSNFFNERSGGKSRVFIDRDYKITLNGETERCRLSTEWVSIELGETIASTNYLYALICIINSMYSPIIKIYKEDGKWYLQYSKGSFTIRELPECFKTPFAQRYIRSLLAKPFVILTGCSGTGKTRISKQFAEYLEVNFENGAKNWLLVPVGADWTDNTKILGFYNPLANDGKGKYEKTAILELIERANLPQNSDIPFFIILDEMNLSYVERYFADFLSHMETPTLEFILEGYSKSVKYPQNLFIVGTVNIDETTYMFSPKVLDRANVIEFKPSKDAVLDLFMNPKDNENIQSAPYGTAEAFKRLAIFIREGNCDLNSDKMVQIQNIFKTIYEVVENSNFEFAYRTVREIRQYISAAYSLAEDKVNFDFYSVIDEQLVQKIFPKIHGNKKELGELLEQLDILCSENNLILSSEKIKRMKGKLADNQYASFI